MALGFVFNVQKSTNSLNGLSVKDPTGGGSSGEPVFMKLEKLSYITWRIDLTGNFFYS